MGWKGVAYLGGREDGEVRVGLPGHEGRRPVKGAAAPSEILRRRRRSRCSSLCVWARACRTRRQQQNHDAGWASSPVQKAHLSTDSSSPAQPAARSSSLLLLLRRHGSAGLLARGGFRQRRLGPDAGRPEPPAELPRARPPSSSSSSST